MASRRHVHLQVLQLRQSKHLGRDGRESVPVQLQHQQCARQIVKIPRLHVHNPVAVDKPVESLKVRGLIRFFGKVKVLPTSPLQRATGEPDHQWSLKLVNAEVPVNKLRFTPMSWDMAQWQSAHWVCVKTPRVPHPVPVQTASKNEKIHSLWF